MKNRRKLTLRTPSARRPRLFRPHLNLLEDRIPPGDIGLTTLFGLPAAESALSASNESALPASNPARPETGPFVFWSAEDLNGSGFESTSAVSLSSPANDALTDATPPSTLAFGSADDLDPLAADPFAADVAGAAPGFRFSSSTDGLGDALPGGAVFSLGTASPANGQPGNGAPSVAASTNGALLTQLASLRGSAAVGPNSSNTPASSSAPTGGPDQPVQSAPITAADPSEGLDPDAFAQLRELLRLGNAYQPGTAGAEAALDQRVADILRSQGAAGSSQGADDGSTGGSFGAPSGGGGGGGDPGALGPFTVQVDEYNFGNQVFDPQAIAGTSRVELTAQVISPTVLTGQRPVLVFMHGNHQATYNPTTGAVQFTWPPNTAAGFVSLPNYRGYEYVGTVLASHGYVVVSVSANGVNVLGGTNMVPRAELMHRTLQVLRDLNTGTGEVTPLPGETLAGDTSPFDTRFVGHLDLNNIGTMGHSRGGDGVVAHFQYETGVPLPGVATLPESERFPIKAVLPLAPVDFTSRTIDNVPLLVILPYRDGDVSDLQGQGFYDRTRYNLPGDTAPKHVITVEGAGHNPYNTIWWAEPGPLFFAPGAFDDGVGPNRLTPPQQRSTAIGYFNAFFRTYVGNSAQPTHPEFLAFLSGDSVPPASVDPAARDRISWQYHPIDDPGSRRDINRLDTLESLSVNTLGGAVTQSLFEYARGFPYGGALGSGTPRSTGLHVMRARWTSPDHFWQNDLPVGSRNLSGYSHLSFRAALDFSVPENPAGLPQDFQIVLTDGTGASASTTVNTAYAGRPAPIYFPPLNRHQVMNTVRIPLSLFSGVNLSNIVSIRFNFNVTASGAVRFADLMVTSDDLDLNNPPVLSPIADRTMTASQTTLDVPLTASDPDGDPLTFSATGQSQAYLLDQTHDFSMDAGGFYPNFFGADERWLRSVAAATGWVFILPTGAVHAWDGSASASGPLLANVGSWYHANPTRLINVPVNQPHATFSFIGSTLRITRPDTSILSNFRVTVTVSDGQGGTDSESFNVTITPSMGSPPVLAPISDQTMTAAQTTLDVPLMASDPDGDPLSFSATGQTVASILDQTHDFFYDTALHPPDFYLNFFGAMEKWVQTNAVASGWAFLLPNGELRAWDGSGSASGPLLGHVGQYYYADPNRLINAAAGPFATFSFLTGPDRLRITRPDTSIRSSLRVTVTVSDPSGGTASRMFTVTVL